MRMEQYNSTKSITLEIRNRILNKGLLLLSIALIPLIISSLSRASDIGWQAYLYIMVIVTPLIWVAYFWRNSISLTIRAHLFIGSLFALGATAFWSTGLLGGGSWVFLLTNVLATILLGSRWGWGIILATVISMTITSFAIVYGIVVYPFDVPSFVTDPKVLSLAILSTATVLSIVTSSMGMLYNYLDRNITQSNKRAEELVKEIHERETAEKAQKKSEDKFQTIVENMQDVYFKTAMDGEIRYCSPSCLMMSGYSQEELIGNSSSILYHNPADRQQVISALSQDSRLYGLELLFKNKNGSIYDTEFNADLIFDDQGNPDGIRGTIRDVTTPKKAKEQMQRAEKMEAIGLMAGGVAHDLNNIITSIVGYPDLMLKTLPEDSELHKPLNAIKESGQRAAEIIADLLTVSSGAATSLEVHDLRQLIAEYNQSPEFKMVNQSSPDVLITTSYDTTDPVIACSPVHIKKCLMNLVNNAVEAILTKGTIEISTSMETLDNTVAAAHHIQQGDYIVLTIADDGSGIEVSDLAHIFEPFYSKKHLGRSGTGLGLAIVWNTVRNHNGTVTVNSNAEGTVFKLYFPYLEEDMSIALNSDTLNKVDEGKGETVLIIDDERNVRDVANQILSTHGYLVSEVSSGEEAITYLQNNQADIILLDMLMEPGINGRKTYEQILGVSPGQKALICSGFSASEDVTETLALGAGLFIKKPFTKDQLCLALRKVLDSK